MSGTSFDIATYAPEQLAAIISQYYDNWRKQRATTEGRWEEIRQYLYATSTAETSNASVGGLSADEEQRRGWSHSTHIPKLTQIYDNLSANYMMALFSRDKWLDYQGSNSNSNTARKRKLAESYMLTKWKLAKLTREVQKCIDDWIQTGNCFAITSFSHVTSTDEETGEVTVDYTGPVLKRVSPYDIVYNPLAETFSSTPKIIYCIKTVGELMREVEENPEAGWMKEVIKNAAEVRTLTTSPKQERYLNKLRHLQIAGYGSPWEYLKSGYVEILEFHGDIYNQATGVFEKDRIISVVDRSFVARNVPSGGQRIFHAGWRTRPESLWAMGPLDNLVGMQYMINHLQNTMADVFDDIVIPVVVTQGDVSAEGEKYGGALAQRYHIDGADGAVNFLRPDSTVLQADMKIQLLEAMMEAYAGSPREAMGIRTPGEKTAFEIQQLQNAAGRIFQKKIDDFSENFMEPVINSMLALASKYMQGADTIEVTNDEFGSVEFKTITKKDLTSNGRLIPMGSRHFAEKARVAQTLQVLNQVLTAEEKLHIGSIDMARAFVEATGIEDILPVTPYIRLNETADAQRINNVMQEEVQAEAQAPV